MPYTVQIKYIDHRTRHLSEAERVIYTCGGYLICIVSFKLTELGPMSNTLSLAARLCLRQKHLRLTFKPSLLSRYMSYLTESGRNIFIPISGRSLYLTSSGNDQPNLVSIGF